MDAAPGVCCNLDGRTFPDGMLDRKWGSRLVAVGF